jgi:hypothetical protein
VTRPHLEVADILAAHGDAYVDRHRGRLSRGQLKVISAIRACRTAALGGHVARCESCDHLAIAYNSCRNRHCPKCQGQAAQAWLEERQADLLPVPYYHVVFTLPAPISAMAFQNKAVVYDLLFRTAADTLLTIAADPKHLGARIGLTAVLHTWGSALTHHPHVHVVVPGGGLAPDGSRWIAWPAPIAAAGSPSMATSRISPILPPSRPISRRCNDRSGWSTPSAPSPGRRPCSPTWPATPTGSRSRTAGSSPSTSAA